VQLGHLTTRQVEVVRAAAEGLTFREIARLLGVTNSTVEHHIGEAKARTGASTLPEVVARCYAADLLVAGVWPPRWSGNLCLGDLFTIAE
jgi:DNA-binding NarL/FixJ family response regulator